MKNVWSVIVVCFRSTHMLVTCQTLILQQAYSILYRFSFSSSQSVIVYHVEQFWAANRGPPQINEKIYMIAFLFNEMNVSENVASNTWSFPWA